MNVLRRWVHQPQRVWLRRALFQVHLWTGICLGLYVLMISLTGSVLVYRNELFRASPRVMRATEWLLDLHDNLLAGEAGRSVNGACAFAVLALAASGLVIWWPGIKTWRRGLMLPRGLGWRRTTWHLHSLIGFWTAGFTIVLGLSGAYFSFPELFQWMADVLDPVTDPTLVATRVSDHVIYWIAYLHFGASASASVPRRMCDQATKAGRLHLARGAGCNQRDRLVESTNLEATSWPNSTLSRDSNSELGSTKPREGESRARRSVAVKMD